MADWLERQMPIADTRSVNSYEFVDEWDRLGENAAHRLDNNDGLLRREGTPALHAWTLVEQMAANSLGETKQLNVWPQELIRTNFKHTSE